MPREIKIDYFSDVLCIWAWIAQRRNEELESTWGNSISVRDHYLNLFGDTFGRTEKSWADRGGFEGFGQHVLESAAPYEDAFVNPAIWSKVRPRTSANAHLVIRSTAICVSEREATGLARNIRKSFFVDATDVGRLANLYEIVEKSELDVQSVKECVDDGSAAAALMADYKLAESLKITGSPSWVMNGGRQTLYGNVGYKVLNANVEGLLSVRGEDASWC